MKILIKEVIGGSTNGKPGAFYDYTIKGLTENSLEIKIFIVLNYLILRWIK